MSYKFNDEVPIYLQIIELIKQRIISKKYLSKQKLPSIRELSFELEVNPNTIQKALIELEDLGLIYTDRTNGKFVTDNEVLIDEIKNKTILKKIDLFYNSMSEIGISKSEAIKILLEEGDK